MLVASALLSACASLPDGKTTREQNPAQRIAATGDHAGASRAYLDLAMTATGEQRQRYLIFAANELFLANDLPGAERVLRQAGPDIAPRNLEVWAEATANIKLAQDDPEAALAALNRVTGTDDRGSAARILMLRANALFRLGRPQPAVAELVKRERLLSGQAALDDNRRAIWSGLQATGEQIPEPAAGIEPVVAGWLELGRLSYQYRASTALFAEQLELWRAQNPGHPASERLIPDVLANLSTLSNYPERVAVLLPLSGPQQAVGEAIRDGYMAAHYAYGGEAKGPEILFYDTQRSGVNNAFQSALAADAGFVVGPLLKEDIAALAGVNTSVSVLALNYAPDDVDLPTGFFQFALAPEDEARAAADRAVGEGLYNAVALVPDNSWGQRVLQAFREQLEARGGNLLAAEQYPSDTPDFSVQIRRMLLLDESTKRYERLTSNLNRKLEFEPRRRQDVDLVFIGANTAAAKLIKPQLSFHYAGDLPSFATSAVYQPGSTDNADLNGVIFPDMPWLLDPNQTVSTSQATLEKYWGTGAVRLARFYAMGYDSYYLTAMLNGRGGKPGMTVDGMSGRLYVDDAGQLHRQLQWAQIERGEPRLLPALAVELTQQADIASEAPAQ